MELLEQIRTPLRSLVITQTCMHRLTLTMTLRSLAVLQCLTCVLVRAPIKSTYLIKQANFVACHNPSYVNKYNMVQELVDGGTFLLNCPWDMEGLEKHLTGTGKSLHC